MTRDLLTQAYSALKHNRRRSTLTMLGMAWGIATVVILLAYGAGFERAIMTFFSGMGSNLIGVFPGRTSLQAGGAKAGTQVRFTLDDIDYLSAEVPLLKRVAPFVEKNDATIGYDIRSLQTPVDGVYPAFLQIRNMKADDGRVRLEQLLAGADVTDDPLAAAQVWPLLVLGGTERGPAPDVDRRPKP